MELTTWIEGLAIIAVATGMVVAGHLISEPVLGQWATLVFGAGIGYLGHGARSGS